ncbi:MAG: hypothetical protein AB7W59_09645 [Acidimicrobiia bacterium]
MIYPREGATQSRLSWGRRRVDTKSRRQRHQTVASGQAAEAHPTSATEQEGGPWRTVAAVRGEDADHLRSRDALRPQVADDLDVMPAHEKTPAALQRPAQQRHQR